MASPIPETTASLLPKIPFRQILWSKKVKIGDGSYAQVFEVKHNLTSPCAAKELQFPRPSTSNSESNAVMKSNFFRLCDLWSRLRHHNVVQFLGICYPSKDETGLPAMILEKMQGSVTSLLQEHENIPLLVKFSILYDASLGLLYLHTHNPPIVHRDVTSKNIMLTPYLEAKITDPFINTMMTERNKKISFSLPISRSSDNACRLFTQNINLQKELQVDVLSFGKVILHVVTDQEPIPLKSDLNVSGAEQYQKCIDMITGDHTAKLSDLITGCLEPKNKPQWYAPGSVALDYITCRLNEMKIKCRKKYTRDSTDPLAWLTEIKQISLPTYIPLQILPEHSKLDLFNDNVYVEWEETELPLNYESYMMDSTAVLLNGTIYLGGVRSMICIYHPDTNKWDCDNAINTPQHNFGFTVLTNKLVIAGGLKEKSIHNQKEEITNNVLTWEDGKWTEYARMPTARYATTAIGYQSQLIVMGGCSDYKHPNSIVEILNSTTRQWLTCNNLSHPLICVKSVIKGNILYVLGGYSESASSKEEFTQSEHTKRVYATSLSLPDHHLNWQRLTDTPWYGSSVANLDNHVLAVGGIQTHNDTVCVLRSKTGSMITSTSWEPIGSLPVGNLFNSAVIGLDNQIIVYGGGLYSKSNYNIFLKQLIYPPICMSVLCILH